MGGSLIGAAGSVLGGVAGGKGASKAARIQAAAYQKGIDEQNHEFSVVQQNEQPYQQAGTSGLSALLDLLGLGSGGAQGQQSAIDALKNSPLFTSQYNTGADTILQNAAATGGLRGGNTQNSLANFGSSLLSNVIQNQIGNYGNLVGVGQNAAAGTNSAALSTGNQISSLLGQQGGANASATAAPYAALQQILSGLGGSGAFSGGGGGFNTAQNNAGISQALSGANSAGLGAIIRGW